MTSFEQFEANRRNALRSTGPKTDDGKRRSRVNAVRHGLTAETVVGSLEDAEDYKAFEAAIISDYCAETALARELVLRLASLLWRLRRATAIETDLIEIQAEALRERRLRGPLNRTQAPNDAAYRAFESTLARGNITHGSNLIPARRRPNSSKLTAAPVITTIVSANCLTASFVLPISTAACSSASTAMKLLFGGKPCRRYSLFIRSDDDKLEKAARWLVGDYVDAQVI
jgi:hypothetical protein